MYCICPNPYLETIPNENCRFDIKQIQKIVFQRKSGTVADLHLYATWQTLVSATDNTKFVISPFIGGDPIITAGEPISSGGGDNSTKNGIEEINATNPSVFSCHFKSNTTLQEVAFKKFMCEKNLTVYFINQDGKVFCNDGGVLNSGFGISIYGLFFSDKQNDGFGTKDKNLLKFSLKAGWSENLIMINPEFNPLNTVEPIVLGGFSDGFSDGFNN